MAAQKNYAVWVYGLVLELFLTTIEVPVLVFTCCKQAEAVSRPGSCTSNNNSGPCCSSELSRRLHSMEVRFNTCSTGTGFSVRPSVFNCQYHFNSASYAPSSVNLKRKADRAWGPSYTCGALSETGGPSRKKSSLIAYLHEIKSRLKLGNACYYSVQNLLSSSLLSKKLKIKIYRIIILPVVL